MPAVILQHKSSPVTFDPYPQTTEGIAAVKAQAEAARFDLPSEDEFERLEAQERLYALIHRYGADRVQRWVRNLAAMAGQEIS